MTNEPGQSALVIMEVLDEIDDDINVVLDYVISKLQSKVDLLSVITLSHYFYSHSDQILNCFQLSWV